MGVRAVAIDRGLVEAAMSNRESEVDVRPRCGWTTPSRCDGWLIRRPRRAQRGRRRPGGRAGPHAPGGRGRRRDPTGPGAPARWVAELSRWRGASRLRRAWRGEAEPARPGARRARRRREATPEREATRRARASEAKPSTRPRGARAV